MNIRISHTKMYGGHGIHLTLLNNAKIKHIQPISVVFTSIIINCYLITRQLRIKISQFHPVIQNITEGDTLQLWEIAIHNETTYLTVFPIPTYLL